MALASSSIALKSYLDSKGNQCCESGKRFEDDEVPKQWPKNISLKRYRRSIDRIEKQKKPILTFWLRRTQSSFIKCVLSLSILPVIDKGLSMEVKDVGELYTANHML